MKQSDTVIRRHTPEFWNRQHAVQRQRWTEPIARRAAAIFDALPRKTVHEFGFGNLPLARFLENCPWKGADFSEVAVAHAKEIGLEAELASCDEVPISPGDYVCAIAMLPNLPEETMLRFLENASVAEHAVFSIKRGAAPFHNESGLREKLSSWWPTVEVEAVGAGLIAHCSKAEPSGPILTVGCSTLLDFQGVNYTFGSWQAHHGDFDGAVEYVCVDNHCEPTRRAVGVRGAYCETCKKIITEAKKKDRKATGDGPVCEECVQALKDMEAIVCGEGGRYIRWA
ncbi:MAG TPA: class I SAM-dependent methyltransferase, partial [Planctomycetota bacterium]|nr:class I SAM-dependent methyltransferase [Planctomycetota bacterium]